MKKIATVAVFIVLLFAPGAIAVTKPERLNTENTYSDFFALASDSPSIGAVCQTFGYYSQNDGGDAKYVISSGTSPYPYCDIQIDASKYAKLIQVPGGLGFNARGAGLKPYPAVSGGESINHLILRDLLKKASAEGVGLGGGDVDIPRGRYLLGSSVIASGCQNLRIHGAENPLIYGGAGGGYDGATLFYTDNNLIGTAAFDFDNCSRITFKNICLRGDSAATYPTKIGVFFGDYENITPAYSGHLIEGLNVSFFGIGLKNLNGGISTYRDIQISNCASVGMFLEWTGDSHIYNINLNTNGYATTNSSIDAGVGLLTRYGGNTTIVGGKIEFNSKGWVIDGQHGTSMSNVIFDANAMGNILAFGARPLHPNGTTYDRPIEGVNITGCRFLNGGTAFDYEGAGVYVRAALQSVILNFSGCDFSTCGIGAQKYDTTAPIGPVIGFYATGTYLCAIQCKDSLMTGYGESATYPAYVAWAAGTNTRILLGGWMDVLATTAQVLGGSVQVDAMDRGVSEILLAGSSGAAAYKFKTSEWEAGRGFVDVLFNVELTNVSTLSGDLALTGFPYFCTGQFPAPLQIGISSGLAASVSTIIGDIVPGSSTVDLYKITSAGIRSRLNAADLTNGSIIRGRLNYRISK